MSEGTERTEGTKMNFALPSVIDYEFVVAMASAIVDKQDEKGDWRGCQLDSEYMCDKLSEHVAEAISDTFFFSVTPVSELKERLVHVANYAMIYWALLNLKDEEETQDEKVV